MGGKERGGGGPITQATGQNDVGPRKDEAVAPVLAGAKLEA